MQLYRGHVDITLTQLRYFVEAASQLSMTRAAERLNVAQSAVSSAIAQLERQVGTQFFVRQRSKGLVLTPAGELFTRDAQSILAHVEESLDNARGEQQSLAGRVRLACFSTLAPFLLPGVLTRLREEHPALILDVIETDTAGCMNALMTGQADLALCYDLSLPAGIARTVVDGAPGHTWHCRPITGLSAGAVLDLLSCRVSHSCCSTCPTLGPRFSHWQVPGGVSQMYCFGLRATRLCAPLLRTAMATQSCTRDLIMT